MNEKFNKTFRLTIQMVEDKTKAIVIEPPFTIEFDINRNTGSQANTGNFKIYNLSASTRKNIFQDLFQLSADRKVIFEAGYNGQLSTLFIGTLKTAYSGRKGTEIITEINAWDDGFGSMLTTYSAKTYSAGWTQKDLLKAQMRAMCSTNGLEMGEVGEFDINPQPRGVSIVGNTFAVLNKHADGLVFIDNNRIHALNNHEVIDGLVQKIDSSTGLLGTPKRQDAKLMIDCIFEPRIVIAQVIECESDVQPQYNGQYKVMGVHHNGIISENISGECRTGLQLLMPNLLGSDGKEMNLIRGDEVIPVHQKFSTNIRPEINKLIYKYCSRYGVDQNLMKALIKQESGFGHFRADGAIKTSSAGAIGICQLMPATAQRLGVNPYDLEDNIKGGAMYLANALSHYNGDKIKAIASYNAGVGAVDKYNGIPPYNETRHYVRAVLANYSVYKGTI